MKKMTKELTKKLMMMMMILMMMMIMMMMEMGMRRKNIKTHTKVKWSILMFFIDFSF